MTMVPHLSVTLLIVVDCVVRRLGWDLWFGDCFAIGLVSSWSHGVACLQWSMNLYTASDLLFHACLRICSCLAVYNWWCRGCIDVDAWRWEVSTYCLCLVRNGSLFVKLCWALVKEEYCFFLPLHRADSKIDLLLAWMFTCHLLRCSMGLVSSLV